MFEIFKCFTFDAAHQLEDNVAGDHRYAHVHGHSFTAKITLRGEADPETGWVMDYEALEQALAPLRSALDHRYLNDVEGLEKPTLENICAWIWVHLKPALPLLHEIEIRRGTLGEGCIYRGR